MSKHDVAQNSKIGIVCSRFNMPISQNLLNGTLDRLAHYEMSNENINIAWVPGCLEIPIIAQQFALTKNLNAVIALGCVIRGETSHYDLVCNQVSVGCQEVALTYNLPIIFGVLTIEHAEQAYARLGGAHGHKGHECADAALDIIATFRAFDEFKK